MPENLGSKLNSIKQLQLLSTKGDFIVTYKATGSIVLAKNFGKEVLQYPNPSAILVDKFEYPYLYTIHENDILQILNIEQKTLEKYVQTADSKMNSIFFIKIWIEGFLFLKHKTRFKTVFNSADGWQEVILCDSQ